MTPEQRLAAGLTLAVGAHVVLSLTSDAIVKAIFVGSEMEEPPPIAVAVLTVGVLGVISLVATHLPATEST